MKRRSCQLYRMPTRLMAMLVTISDEPLAQAFPMTGQRRCGRTKYRCVERLRAK